MYSSRTSTRASWDRRLKGDVLQVGPVNRDPVSSTWKVLHVTMNLFLGVWSDQAVRSRVSNHL